MRKLVTAALFILCAVAYADELPPPRAAVPATITIYRLPRQAAKWRRPTVLCDELVAGIIHNGEAIDYETGPGKHALKTEDLPGFTLTAETAGHYYARVEFVDGLLAGNWRVTMIDPQQGEAESHNLRREKR